MTSRPRKRTGGVNLGRQRSLKCVNARIAQAEYRPDACLPSLPGQHSLRRSLPLAERKWEKAMSYARRR